MKVTLALQGVLLLVGCLPWDGSAACTEGEEFCSSNCTTVKLCTGPNDASVDLVTCDHNNGFFCNSTSMMCEEGIVCVPPANQDEYACIAIGRFPNPYDCHSFFNCLAADPAAPIQKTDCDASGVNAYDPLSGTCILGGNSRVCTESPLPKCTYAGQKGASIENPNLYFYCYTKDANGPLVYAMNRCSNPANVFVDGKCQADNSSTTAAPPTTSSTTDTTTTSTTTTGTTTPTTTSTTTTATTTVTTTAPPTTTPYPCNETNTVDKDPDSCYSFYICDINLHPIHQNCKSGYYFNVAAGICTKGDCPY